MNDASIAEVLGNDKAEQELRKRALDDLVDRIMDGEVYPKHQRTSICLDDILQESDTVELSGVIRASLFGRYGPADSFCVLRDDVETLVRNYLNDSRWHTQRIEEITLEERDERS